MPPRATVPPPVNPVPAVTVTDELASDALGIAARVPVTVDPAPENASPPAPVNVIAPPDVVAEPDEVLNVIEAISEEVMVTVLPEAEVVMPAPPRISKTFAAGIAVPTFATKLVGTLEGSEPDVIPKMPAWLMFTFHISLRARIFGRCFFLKF